MRLAQLRREVGRLEDELEMQAGDDDVAAVPAEGFTDVFSLLDRYAGDFLSIHAANGDYLYASPAVAALFGWQSEELIGTNAYGYFHPEDYARIASSHATHSDGDEAEIDRVRYRLRCAGGEYRWVETVARARRSDAQVGEIVCITRDVHEEHTSRLRAQRFEDELVRSHHHQFSRQLADALAHELSNPLMGAIGAAQLLRLGRDGALDALERSLDRIQRVIQELTLLTSMSTAIELVAVDAVLRRLVELDQVAAYVDRTELEPTELDAPPATVYHLAHAMLQLHTRWSKTPAAAGLFIRCASTELGVEIEMRSKTEGLDRHVRADLLAAIRGTTGAANIPLRLAQSICEDDLRGTWTTQMDSGLLRTHAVIPRSEG